LSHSPHSPSVILPQNRQQPTTQHTTKKRSKIHLLIRLFSLRSLTPFLLLLQIHARLLPPLRLAFKLTNHPPQVIDLVLSTAQLLVHVRELLDRQLALVLRLQKALGLQVGPLLQIKHLRIQLVLFDVERAHGSLQLLPLALLLELTLLGRLVHGTQLFELASGTLELLFSAPPGGVKNRKFVTGL